MQRTHEQDRNDVIIHENGSFRFTSFCINSFIPYIHQNIRTSNKQTGTRRALCDTSRIRHSRPTWTWSAMRGKCGLVRILLWQYSTVHYFLLYVIHHLYTLHWRNKVLIIFWEQRIILDHLPLGKLKNLFRKNKIARPPFSRDKNIFA